MNSRGLTAPQHKCRISEPLSVRCGVRWAEPSFGSAKRKAEVPIPGTAMTLSLRAPRAAPVRVRSRRRPAEGSRSASNNPSPGSGPSASGQIETCRGAQRGQERCPRLGIQSSCQQSCSLHRNAPCGARRSRFSPVSALHRRSSDGQFWPQDRHACGRSGYSNAFDGDPAENRTTGPIRNHNRCPSQFAGVA